MRYFKKFLFLITLLLTTLSSLHGEGRKRGFETELVQPFIPHVHTFRLAVSEPVMEHDLVLGAYLRPYVKHDGVEEIQVGYTFDFELGGFSLYSIPQFGYMKGLSTNIGPRKDPDEFVTGEWIFGAYLFD